MEIPVNWEVWDQKHKLGKIKERVLVLIIMILCLNFQPEEA